MQLRLSASGRTAQQPKSYCTTLPCSKAQARYLSQNIGIDSNCKTLHAKENYKVVCRVLMHHRAEDAYALMSAHIRPSAEAPVSDFHKEGGRPSRLWAQARKRRHAKRDDPNERPSKTSLNQALRSFARPESRLQYTEPTECFEDCYGRH